MGRYLDVLMKRIISIKNTIKINVKKCDKGESLSLRQPVFRDWPSSFSNKIVPGSAGLASALATRLSIHPYISISNQPNSGAGLRSPIRGLRSGGFWPDNSEFAGNFSKKPDSRNRDIFHASACPNGRHVSVRIQFILARRLRIDLQPRRLILQGIGQLYQGKWRERAI